MERLLVYSALVSLLFGGCLKTRDDIKSTEMETNMRRQVSELQKINADSSSAIDELNSSYRTVTGKIEELEHRLHLADQEKKKSKEELEQTTSANKEQMNAFQENIVKLESELQVLKEEMAELKSTAKASPVLSKSNDSKGSSEKGNALFQKALGEFQDKKWKKAILSFDQYREKEPSGKFVAEATYKTGVCFQELGMVDEARLFYQETLSKFPRTEMSKKAQTRLKSLK